MKERTKKEFQLAVAAFFASVVLLAAACAFYFYTKQPIKIGILHSITGSQSMSEKPLIDAEIMAIDEINQQGGIIGRKIIPIIKDGKSDEKIFAAQAESLIKDEKVDAIIGCWTSASRKAVKAVVEKYDNLLIYPVSYEGIEDSSHILYTGATQNQQITVCALWSFYNLGKKFFLVGSDYIFSRTANQIIKNVVACVNAEIVGEDYILLGAADVTGMVAKILAANPDIIINTIQGESNVAFFKELRERGITSEKIPVMSISSVTEVEFAQIGNSAMAGDYVTASYFQSLETEQNANFVSQFKQKYGPARVLNEACEAGYIGVHFWAQAISDAKSSQANQVRKYLHDRVLSAPSGIVYTDHESFNTWKMVYVGKLRADGQFSIIWDSKKTIKPVNYPIFKEKESWDQFIKDLYESWGNRWSRQTG